MWPVLKLISNSVRLNSRADAVNLLYYLLYVPSVNMAYIINRALYSLVQKKKGHFRVTI